MAADRRTFDVVIAGAGVFGAWIAFHVQRAGLSALLLDAFGPGNSRASSGGESRILRMGYGGDAIYTRSAIRSRPQWQELSERSGLPLFQPIGVLWVARDGDPYTALTVDTLARCGVPFEHLDRTALERRYPQMRFDPLTQGIFEPLGGMLLARQAVQAVVRDAMRIGLTYRQGGASQPSGRGRVASIRTTAGESVSGGAFVYACGPWLPKEFPDLLGGLIRTTRQEVFFFGVEPGDDRFSAPLMPAWMDFGTGTYGGPDIDGRGFKIGLDRHGPPIDPDTADRLASPDALAHVRSVLSGRFPALASAPVVETRVCQYANTSTGDLLLDRHPDFDNVWLAGGGSGHGFKHGPAVGEYVRDLLRGTGTAEPRFSLASKSTTHARAVY